MFQIITDNVLFKNQVDTVLKDFTRQGSFSTRIVITDKDFEASAIKEKEYYFVLKKEGINHHPNCVYFSTQEELHSLLSLFHTSILENEKQEAKIRQLEQENNILKDKNEDIQNHSEGARKVQKRIYKDQTSAYFDIDLHYQYYQCISGDLFFIRTLKERTYLVFGDVTHHGVRAGLYGTSLYTLLSVYFNTIQDNYISLSSILSFLNYNATIFGYTNEDTFHALFVEIDHKNNKLKQFCFGQAGEPIILMNKDTKEVSELRATNIYAEINNYFTKPEEARADEFQLPENYALLLYTDGLRELFKAQEKENIKEAYSLERMKKLISTNLQENRLDKIIPDFIEDCNNFSLTDNVNDTDDNSAKYIVNALDDVTIALLTPR